MLNIMYDLPENEAGRTYTITEQVVRAERSRSSTPRPRECLAIAVDRKDRSHACHSHEKLALRCDRLDVRGLCPGDQTGAVENSAYRLTANVAEGTIHVTLDDRLLGIRIAEGPYLYRRGPRMSAPWTTL